MTAARLCGVCDRRPVAPKRLFAEAHEAGMCQACYVSLSLEVEHAGVGHPQPVYGCPGCGLNDRERPKVTPGGRAAPVAPRVGTKVCAICHNEKKVQEFPTFWRTRRGDECRKCRDERIDRQRELEGRPPQHRCWVRPVEKDDGWHCRMCDKLLVPADEDMVNST